MHSITENPLSRFYERILDMQDWKDRETAFTNEVIETGGTFTLPNKENWPASHMAEISLHEVTAYGATLQEAIENWIENATRALTAAQPIGMPA